MNRDTTNHPLLRLRRLGALLVLATALPVAAHGPGAAGGNAGDWHAQMDKHMQAMQTLHERYAAAKTPEERQSLWEQQHRHMHDAMREMGGIGPGAGVGHGPAGRGMGPGMHMGAAPGTGGAGSAASHEARIRALETRMSMMQTLMQQMVQRGAPAAADAAKR